MYRANSDSTLSKNENLYIQSFKYLIKFKIFFNTIFHSNLKEIIILYIMHKKETKFESPKLPNDKAK